MLMEYNDITLKEMLTNPEVYERFGDLDGWDDVIDDLFCAWCGTQLTDAGIEEFKDVLHLSVDVSEDGFEVKIDNEPKWERLHDRLSELFASAAGYCSEEDYDKWFKEV